MRTDKSPKKLTPRQLKAVEALAACADVTQAALTAGISRDTMYRWLRDPNFKVGLDQAVSDAINELSHKLVTLGSKAAQSLEEALADSDATTAVKIRAADVILARLLQLRQQHTLEERLTQLEEKNEH